MKNKIPLIFIVLLTISCSSTNQIDNTIHSFLDNLSKDQKELAYDYVDKGFLVNNEELIQLTQKNELGKIIGFKNPAMSGVSGGTNLMIECSTVTKILVYEKGTKSFAFTCCRKGLGAFKITKIQSSDLMLSPKKE